MIFVAVDEEIPFIVDDDADVDEVEIGCPLGRITWLRVKEGTIIVMRVFVVVEGQVVGVHENPFDLILTRDDDEDDDDDDPKRDFVPPNKLAENPKVGVEFDEETVGARTKEARQEVVVLMAPAATAARTASEFAEKGFVPTS